MKKLLIIGVIAVIVIGATVTTIFVLNKSKDYEVKVPEKKLFTKGMVAVEKNGKWGVIDRNGKEVVPFKYYSAKIDPRTGWDELCEFGEDGQGKTNGDGVFDPKKREFIISQMYSFIEFSEDSDYILACMESDTEEDESDYGQSEPENEYLYLKKNDNDVFEKSFQSAETFSDGLARVKEQGKDKYGYINTKGKYVIKPKYKYVESFNHGAAAVSEEGGCGRYLINKKGEKITGNKYRYLVKKYNDEKKALWLVSTKNKKCGFINSKGEEVIEPVYDTAMVNSSGLITVWKNKKKGLIDSDGNILIDVKYDDISIDAYSDVRGVQINNKWGFVNKEGEIVIKPKYEEVKGFNNSNLCPVKLKGKWGYINKKGKNVIPFKYDQVEDFEKETAVVLLDDVNYIINEEGDTLKKFSNDYKRILRFDDGFLAITGSSKWKILNNKYNPICDDEFDCINLNSQVVGGTDVERLVYSNTDLKICAQEGCYNVIKCDTNDNSKLQYCDEHANK